MQIASPMAAVDVVFLMFISLYFPFLSFCICAAHRMPRKIELESYAYFTATECRRGAPPRWRHSQLGRPMKLHLNESAGSAVDGVEQDFLGGGSALLPFRHLEGVQDVPPMLRLVGNAGHMLRKRFGVQP